jgi:hypothetical protein
MLSTWLRGTLAKQHQQQQQRDGEELSVIYYYLFIKLFCHVQERNARQHNTLF